MPRKFTESDLEAYLDEALEPNKMAEFEKTLRKQPELLQQLALINSRRDAGLHSVGEIWRRHRVSCPTREQLGSYLLEALNDELRDYIEFHTPIRRLPILPRKPRRSQTPTSRSRRIRGNSSAKVFSIKRRIFEESENRAKSI